MAARSALEWIGTSKAQQVFRYEISDSFANLLEAVFEAIFLLTTSR